MPQPLTHAYLWWGYRRNGICHLTNLSTCKMHQNFEDMIQPSCDYVEIHELTWLIVLKLTSGLTD